jgi:uncharacterized surface protein with fasciclin (FAS1) repeats
LEIAAGQEQLETFVQAVESTGLVEMLDGEGPFTVFAPTDEAFAALSDQDLSDLMVDSTPLEAVLQYHVVPGEIIAGRSRPLQKHSQSQTSHWHSLLRKTGCG